MAEGDSTGVNLQYAGHLQQHSSSSTETCTSTATANKEDGQCNSSLVPSDRSQNQNLANPATVAAADQAAATTAAAQHATPYAAVVTAAVANAATDACSNMHSLPHLGTMNAGARLQFASVSKDGLLAVHLANGMHCPSDLLRHSWQAMPGWTSYG